MTLQPIAAQRTLSTAQTAIRLRNKWLDAPALPATINAPADATAPPAASLAQTIAARYPASIISRDQTGSTSSIALRSSAPPRLLGEHTTKTFDLGSVAAKAIYAAHSRWMIKRAGRKLDNGLDGTVDLGTVRHAPT
jgi:hypothetical protein